MKYVSSLLEFIIKSRIEFFTNESFNFFFITKSLSGGMIQIGGVGVNFQEGQRTD